MTTPDVWKDLLRQFPSPPIGPAADEDVVANTTISAVATASATITEAVATEIWRGAASSAPPRTPSLFITPANGQELWISRAQGAGRNLALQRVPQLQQLHGPEWRLGTTDTTSSEAIDPAGEVIQFNKRALRSEAYGNITGRILYYPYFRAHSGIDGLLGYARTGAIFYAMGMYRSYSPRDFPYLPGVIGEWVGLVYCVDFIPRSVGELRYADFKLEFASNPFIFHAGDIPTQILAGRTIGAPTNVGLTNIVLTELPKPNNEEYDNRNSVIRIPLPAVINSGTGAADTAPWVYSVAGLPPSSRFNASTRIITMDAVPTQGGKLSYNVTYTARQTTETTRVELHTATFYIRV